MVEDPKLRRERRDLEEELHQLERDESEPHEDQRHWQIRREEFAADVEDHHSRLPRLDELEDDHSADLP
jgi:hypothetical protein